MTLQRWDIRAYVGRWLYFHGFPTFGSYLYTTSRTWRDYVRAQYDDPEGYE